MVRINKNAISKVICLLLATVSICMCFSSCKSNDNDAIKLSFKSALQFDYLKSIDGRTVTINGYMATSSPVDGSFIFLMNMPYQSCPFCIPNTSQLSNTMEVYPKKNKSFEYTTQAIKVVGTLVVAPSENESDLFTDKYNYKFAFKIVDATYSILSQDELEGNVALWQAIASSNIISEIDAMYNYVNFLCAWNTYYIDNYVNSKGEQMPGYYLYPSDAINYITKDGAQWNYGYKDGYFDNLISKVRSIDDSELEDLVANIEKAENLAAKALNELNSGNYTYEYKYVEKFGTSDYVYTLNNATELNSEFKLLYSEFSNWLGNWEM